MLAESNEMHRLNLDYGDLNLMNDSQWLSHNNETELSSKASMSPRQMNTKMTNHLSRQSPRSRIDWLMIDVVKWMNQQRVDWSRVQWTPRKDRSMVHRSDVEFHRTPWFEFFRLLNLRVEKINNCVQKIRRECWNMTAHVAYHWTPYMDWRHSPLLNI